jgi:hypothetical protein
LDERVTLDGFEIKTLLIDPGTGTITETNLLEEPLNLTAGVE